MTRIPETLSDERRQYLALAVLSFAVGGFTGILCLSQDTSFQRFFGSISPLLAISLVTVLGFLSLGFLRLRGWFEIFSRRERLRGLTLAAALATVFAVAVIMVDLFVGFPRDLNVPPPQSLLFYPAIAYVVEITFHAFPLSLFLILTSRLFKKLNRNRLVWLCVIFNSFLEPTFQMAISKRPLSWAEVYVGPHVFAFNLLQLYVFRRYDFVSMYSFRLVYYLHWHIVWSYLRLQILS
jgi:hypothetical protein